MKKLSLLLLLFILTAGALRAAQADYSVASYDKWTRYDSDTLRHKAYLFLEEEGKRDSALVCFTVLANRYFEGHKSEHDIELATMAMANLGVLYMTFYYDYQKSYEYLLNARGLAEKHHQDKALPVIYNALANVLNVSQGDAESQQEQEQMLRKAFRSAVSQNQETGALTSFCNLFTNAVKQLDSDIVTRELPAMEQLPMADTLRSHYRDLVCQAVRAFADGDYSRAAAFMQQAADHTWNTDVYSRTELGDYMQAIDFYLMAGNQNAAEQLLNNMLRNAREENGKDVLPQIYFKLADLFAHRGDSALHDHYLFLYYKANEAQQAEGNVGDVPNVKLLHDLSLVNEEVKALNEKRRMQQALLLGAAFVILVICILLWRLYVSYRRVDQAHYDLYLRNKQLLEEEQRQRDTIASGQQAFSSLKAENEQLRNALAAASEQAATPQAGSPKPAQPGEATAAAHTQQDLALLKEIYDRVIDFFDHSNDIYLQGFTVMRLSEQLGLRNHDVSRAIGEFSDGNFNALLATYRIKEACRRMSDTGHYGCYTVEGIAESVGFKSRTNFAVLFKQQTGLTPAVYMKMSHKT